MAPLGKRGAYGRAGQSAFIAGRYSEGVSTPVTSAQKTAELITVVTFALVFLGLILEHNVMIAVSLVLFVASLVAVGVADRRHTRR